MRVFVSERNNIQSHINIKKATSVSEIESVLVCLCSEVLNEMYVTRLSVGEIYGLQNYSQAKSRKSTASH